VSEADFPSDHKAYRARPRQRPLVLAMDDSSDMHVLYEAALSGLDCDLIHAHDGREGLLKFVEHRPDLVLLDLDMPVVSGLEVLRRLRSNTTTSGVPVIVVSGMSRELQAQLAQMGIAADSYFEKPFKSHRLQQDVARFLGRERELAIAKVDEGGPLRDASQAFAGYEMLDVLRTDSYSTTWRARQKSLNRLVSLKILTEEASRRADVARLLAQHAKTLGRLKHPNVFRLYDHGRTEYFHYTVYQYVEGISLHDLMAQQTLPYEAAMSVLEKMCSGLQCLHDEGIVLYSLRPSKLVVDFAGELKIADFGLVPSEDDSRLDLSQTSIERATGRLPYTAPEQDRAAVECGSTIDSRTDIYAAAAIAFEMLTWQPCQPGVLPSTLNPGLSSKLDQLFTDALATSARHRPAKIADFWTPLREELLQLIPSSTRRRLGDVDFQPLRQIVRNARPSHEVADR